MDGLMMEFPLTLVHLLERAGQLHRGQEIVSRQPDETIAHDLGRRLLAGAPLRALLAAGPVRVRGPDPAHRHREVPEVHAS
jgi:hypothetical protein